jgi:hypothetical protein
MTESQEVALGMLADYRAWLASGAMRNTMANAVSFVMADRILKDESLSVRSAVSNALYDAECASVTTTAEASAAASDLQASGLTVCLADRVTAKQQTEQDAYWVAHAKALKLQTGSRGSFAALIGDAFIRADSRNAARLIAAFPELLA